MWQENFLGFAAGSVRPASQRRASLSDAQAFFIRSVFFEKTFFLQVPASLSNPQVSVAEQVRAVIYQTRRQVVETPNLERKSSTEHELEQEDKDTNFS